MARIAAKQFGVAAVTVEGECMSSVSHPIFNDLADPSRRDILLGLRSGPRSVMALVELTGLKQPNVSNHLARLRDRGLVKAQRCGRQVFYSLADPLVESLLAAALRGSDAPPERCPLAEEIATWRVRLLEALIAHDERAAGDVVCECLGGHLPLERLYVGVIEPCLALIGQAFVDGTMSIGDEHQATAIIERLMARATQFCVADSPRTRSIVVGCVEGNWHSIGPRMIADVFAGLGWLCTYLGANVPADTFVEIARAKRPNAVLLSCAIAENVDAAADTVAALRRARVEDPSLTFAIGLGGRCIKDDPGAVERLGADFTARDAADLPAVVERWAAVRYH